jgi:hypothetical protein|nr:MAG TPA: transposase-binding protein [Caudoviricetes sp.]
MAILPSVLAQYAERVEKAGFSEKEKIIEEGCAFTGLSRATFLRQIKPYRLRVVAKCGQTRGNIKWMRMS